MALWFGRDIDDCLVCALRPAILFGLPCLYFSLPFCPHVNNVKKPHLKNIPWVTWIFLTLKLITLADIYNDLGKFRLAMSYEILSKFMMKYLRIVNSQLLSFSLFASKSTFQGYMNSWISLLHNRKKFGIHTIFNKRIVFICRAFAFFMIGSMASSTLFYISYVVVKKGPNLKGILEVLSTLLNVYTDISLLMHYVISIQTLDVLLQKIYKHFQSILEEPAKRKTHNDIVFVEVSREDRLRYSRQFYLNICRMYNRNFIRGNAVYFCVQFVTVISLCVFCFQVYMKYTGDSSWWVTADWTLQSFLNFGWMVYANMRAHRVKEAVSILVR